MSHISHFNNATTKAYTRDSCVKTYFRHLSINVYGLHGCKYHSFLHQLKFMETWFPVNINRGSFEFIEYLCYLLWSTVYVGSETLLNAFCYLRRYLCRKPVGSYIPTSQVNHRLRCHIQL